MEQGIKIDFDNLVNCGVPEFYEQYETEQNKIAEKEKERKKIEWYKSANSGVKKRYWEESIDTYKPETEEETKNLEYVKKFIQGEGRQMLLLLGKYGTGKTHLGASIIRELGGRMITSFELGVMFEMGSDYKATMNKTEVLKMFSECSVLVIDEIGRGKTDIEKQLLPYIINARYENMLQTVLITNLEKSQFSELLGSATIDRLKEVCATLSFNGRSRRQ